MWVTESGMLDSVKELSAKTPSLVLELVMVKFFKELQHRKA